MARPCTVCAHADRPAIDAELVSGTPFRNIAERTGLSTTALFRHKAEHVPAALTKARDAREAADADTLLGQLRALQGRTMRILDAAEAAADLRTALLAIREARGTLELLAELEGELSRQPVLSVLVSPQWLQVRALLVQALAPYPEASLAVAGHLARLETA